MKILHLTPSFSPSIGGVEEHVLQIAKQQIINGHQVQVMTLDCGKKQEIISGIRVKRLNIKNKNKFFKKIEVFFKIIQNFPYFWHQDVIQVHDIFWTILPIYPFIYSKILTTFHGWEGTFPVPKINIFQRRIYSFLSKKVVHIGGYINKYYHDQPDLVLYGGYSELHNQKIPKSNKLVFLGRLEKENCIDKYLSFLDELKKMKINFTVMFIGGGQYHKKCQKYGQVTGMIKDPFPYITNSRVVLTSSYLSIWQALAANKKVISFYDHELKKDYLELFPLKSMTMISDDPHLAAKNFVKFINQLHKQDPQLKKFTWAEVASQYENLINHYYL